MELLDDVNKPLHQSSETIFCWRRSSSFHFDTMMSCQQMPFYFFLFVPYPFYHSDLYARCSLHYRHMNAILHRRAANLPMAFHSFLLLCCFAAEWNSHFCTPPPFPPSFGSCLLACHVPTQIGPSFIHQLADQPTNAMPSLLARHFHPFNYTRIVFVVVCSL